MRCTRGGLGVGSAAKLIVRLNRSRKRAQKRISDRSQEECAICLNPLGTSGTKTLGCKHTFHKECIDEWIAKGNQTCPLCRRRIPGTRTRERRRTVAQLVEDAARMDAETLERAYLRQREGSRSLEIFQDEIDLREEVGDLITSALDDVLLDDDNFDNADLNYESTVGDFLEGHPTGGVLHTIRQFCPRLAPLTDDQILGLQLYRDVIQLTHNLFSWDTMDEDPGH